MILASPFEDTKKSTLNTSAKIIDIVQNRNIQKFEKVVSLVEQELQVSYEKVILSLNFLYMSGALEYKIEEDKLRFGNEA